MNQTLPSAAVSEKPGTDLPSFHEMYAALCASDSRYEGVFIVGVRTTGIFCRPSCTARKPKPENVQFYRNVGAALAAGFRPCKRCRPLQNVLHTPVWIDQLLKDMDADPSIRWTDQRLEQRGLQPATLRRWFKRHYGMTFQCYQRARRLSHAASRIQEGQQVTQAAIDAGYDSLSGFREAFQKWYGEVPRSAGADSGPMILNRLVTPLGPMVVVAIDDSIGLLEFADRRDLESQFRQLVRHTGRQVVSGSHPLFPQLEGQLAEYFDRRRTQFDLPLKVPGTAFQQRVWNSLRQIPYGSVRSYRQIAESIGRSGAHRAVGTANGRNRLAILIPCHRVVRADGNPGGYAGEIWRKQRLLDLESRR